MEDGLGPGLSDQEETHKDEERVKLLAPLARDVVMVLAKTIKATRMYLPNNPVYMKFHEELSEKFDAYFRHEDYLSFIVKRFELTFLDQEVYNNPDKEDNLALMFFKDGIREFCFHKGITPEETHGFIDILKFDVKGRELDDDLVTLLWEKDFRNITYTVTEEATEDEAAVQDAILAFDDTPEAAKALEEMRARAASGMRRDQAADEERRGPSPDAGEDAFGPYAGFLEDAGPVQDFESIRGTCEAPDDLTLLTELTDIFYEILLTEKDREHFEAVVESLERALEIYVKRGDLALATILVMKVQDLARDPRLSGWSSLVDRVVGRACSAPLVKVVGEHIDQGGMEAMEAAGSYLMQLDARAVPAIVGLLETLGNRKSRKAVCDIISDVCGGDGSHLLPFIGHGQWYVVRNVVMVLGKVADPSTVDAVGGALSHLEPKVRREALQALAVIKGATAASYLEKGLSDPAKQNRMTAGRLLAELSPERAFEALTALTAAKEFDDRDLDEKKETYGLIGRTGGERALAFLSERFRKKGFFQGQKREEARVCAAWGLAATGTDEAAKLLKAETGSKSGPLRAACIQGLRGMGRQGA